VRPSAVNVAPVSACDHILASRLLSEEETARGMIAQVADLAAVAFEVLAINRGEDALTVVQQLALSWEAQRE